MSTQEGWAKQSDSKPWLETLGIPLLPEMLPFFGKEKELSEPLQTAVKNNRSLQSAWLREL